MTGNFGAPYRATNRGQAPGGSGSAPAGRPPDLALHRLQRLLSEYGPDAAIGDIMREQIGVCPHRDDAQIPARCDPYCPDLSLRLFGVPKSR